MIIFVHRYHRVKRKAEKRAALKQSVSDLLKEDPEKAKEELEKAERLRAEVMLEIKINPTRITFTCFNSLATLLAISLVTFHNSDSNKRKRRQDGRFLSSHGQCEQDKFFALQKPINLCGKQFTLFALSTLASIPVYHFLEFGVVALFHRKEFP